MIRQCSITMQYYYSEVLTLLGVLWYMLIQLTKEIRNVGIVSFLRGLVSAVVQYLGTCWYS